MEQLPQAQQLQIRAQWDENIDLQHRREQLTSPAAADQNIWQHKCASQQRTDPKPYCYISEHRWQHRAAAQQREAPKSCCCISEEMTAQMCSTAESSSQALLPHIRAQMKHRAAAQQRAALPNLAARDQSTHFSTDPQHSRKQLPSPAASDQNTAEICSEAGSSSQALLLQIRAQITAQKCSTAWSSSPKLSSRRSEYS